MFADRYIPMGLLCGVYEDMNDIYTELKSELEIGPLFGGAVAELKTYPPFAWHQPAQNLAAFFANEGPRHASEGSPLNLLESTSRISWKFYKREPLDRHLIPRCRVESAGTTSKQNGERVAQRCCSGYVPSAHVFTLLPPLASSFSLLSMIPSFSPFPAPRPLAGSTFDNKAY